jgi:hypothetical protein
MATDKTLTEHLRALGKKGHRAQQSKVSPKQLSAWGKRGAKARWGKEKGLKHSTSLRDET